MIELTRLSLTQSQIHHRVALPFEQRQRCRFVISLNDGSQALVLTERGSRLKDGDLLTSIDGLIVQIAARPEALSIVSATDAQQFARACYHFGNRHVALEIDTLCLRYLRDHVLDELALRLGLQVAHNVAPFEPEAGAYTAHTVHDHA